MVVREGSLVDSHNKSTLLKIKQGARSVKWDIASY